MMVCDSCLRLQEELLEAGDGTQIECCHDNGSQSQLSKREETQNYSPMLISKESKSCHGV